MATSSTHTVEASDIGLKPGDWPQTVNFEGVGYGYPDFTWRGGDLLYVTYVSGNGCGPDTRKLVVLND